MQMAAVHCHNESINSFDVTTQKLGPIFHNGASVHRGAGVGLARRIRQDGFLFENMDMGRGSSTAHSVELGCSYADTRRDDRGPNIRHVVVYLEVSARVRQDPIRCDINREDVSSQPVSMRLLGAPISHGRQRICHRSGVGSSLTGNTVPR